ncbi:hypothetical protein [Gilliamella sp. BG7]|uniref:hypothetical protein n=1 Tax=unclassified Gilliamella TaxID=2685620 RepID=UPI003985F631
MTTNYEEAHDLIKSIFVKKWATKAENEIGYKPTIIWQGKDELTKPDKDKCFCRFSVWTAKETQTTLGCNDLDVETWRNRYRTDGYLMVQIFAPKSALNGSELSRSLAVLARDIYRHIDGPVKFKNGRVQELDSEQGFYRTNTIVDFTYDEVG